MGNSVFGWVFTRISKQSSKVDQFGTVQSKDFHGCSPCCRPSNNLQRVVTPGEVTRPRLTAGVEEGNGPPRVDVRGAGLGLFAGIAVGTRPREIAELSLPPCRSRLNMLTMKWSARAISRAPAVFTQTLGALLHSFSQRRRSTPFRHRLRPSVPVASSLPAGLCRGILPGQSGLLCA